MKLILYWSYAFWVTIDETKKICQSFHKERRKGKRREKTRKAITKLFALNAKAIRPVYNLPNCLLKEVKFFK